MKPKSELIQGDLFPVKPGRRTYTYEQENDIEEDSYSGSYEEAMDSLAPDGYDQGFGSDDCS